MFQEDQGTQCPSIRIIALRRGLGLQIDFRVPSSGESCERFFCLLVQIGRGTVENFYGLTLAIEQKHRRYRGDVTESGGGGWVGNGPADVGAQRVCSGTDGVFRRLDGQGDNGQIIPILRFQLTEPLERGAAWRTPGRPKFHERNTSRELICRERMSREIR